MKTQSCVWITTGFILATSNAFAQFGDYGGGNYLLRDPYKRPLIEWLEIAGIVLLAVVLIGLLIWFAKKLNDE